LGFVPGKPTKATKSWGVIGVLGGLSDELGWGGKILIRYGGWVHRLWEKIKKKKVP